MPSMRTCARVSLKGVKEVQKCQSRKNLLTREASYKVPHATCEGTGLQGGWDPSATRLLSASHAHGHTSTLESVMFLSSSFSEYHHSFRAAPSGTRPVSR
jgi:hypothetical protein